ncbi:MAG: glycosyltransferase family 2 protein [Sphingobacteriaceae bacterium]|nr:MAG: glycosyltransferase family 2 protein [Sphingobacteriaceae bacterium]
MRPMKPNFKISFCTVCMNRLHHIKQTLPANIADNEGYDNVEFVLLDYNSTDGLEDYIKAEMQEFINAGKLIYFKTTTPQYFNRSHSRNLACKLATGDIICNIDADNFTGNSFAAYINHQFSSNANVFICVFDNPGHIHKTDVLGRICVKKTDFMAIKGYDERMESYGFEDYDLVNRLKMHGLKSLPFADDDDFFKTVKHQNIDRLSNEFMINNLNSLLINYITPASSEIVFLFKNKKFKQGIVVDNKNFSFPDCLTDIKKSQIKYEYSLLEDEWLEGEWDSYGDGVRLYQHSKPMQKLIYNHKLNRYTLQTDDRTADFYTVTNNNLVQETVMFCSQIANRVLMYKNKHEAKAVVNHEFGKDVVYRNFDYDTALAI